MAARTSILILLLSALLVTAFSGCATTEEEETFYYTLDYLEHTEDRQLQRSDPLPHLVWVQDPDIPRTYSGRQMVVRHFGPKISYSENNLWAGRLSDYIPNLVTSRLMNYNSFRDARIEFLETRPDYEISINVQRVEMIQTDELSEASLEMTLQLRRGTSSEAVLSHTAQRMEPLYSASMEQYVQTLNEMILEETDRFIEKIYDHFDPRPEAARESGESDDEEDPSREPADTQEGHGVILMPSISGVRGTASYRALGEDGTEYDGVFGEDLVVPPGIYELHYGTGPEELQMERHNIEVQRGYRTLVEPDWGEMTVEIIDERRNPREVFFEVFGSDGTSYAARFPAREELGDSPGVLYLPPGQYKVTLDNEPFNTYRNFATIQIVEGQWKQLTMVIDDSEGPVQLVGAGTLSSDEDPIGEKNWDINSAIHATADLAGNHGSEVENGDFSGSMSGQWENQLRYTQDRLSLDASLFSEIGLGYDQDTGLTISQDDIDIKTAGILDILFGMGLYARVDLNSHFFPTYDYDPPEEGSAPVQLAPPLFPLLLREGTGINMRILTLPRASLTLRSGLGLLQEFNNGVQEREEDSDSYIDAQTNTSAGLEISAMGDFRPLHRVQLNTSADVLFPLLEGEDIILEWSAGMNWTLLRSISLNYRFLMENQPQQDAFTLDFSHRLVLRLTYIIN